MSPDSLFEDADLIHSYSRKQAIEDGALVDLMTSAAYFETVGPIDGELPSGQDRTGRLWDVLMVLKAAIRNTKGETDRILFEVRVWNGKKHDIVRLWSLVGPGDTMDPVLTIMCEDED